MVVIKDGPIQIYLNYEFTSTKTQTTNITVLGESGVADVISKDAVATVEVPLTTMNGILSISEATDGNSGNQTSDSNAYPALTFNITGAVTNLLVEKADTLDILAPSFNLPNDDNDYWLTLIPHDAIKSVSVTPGSFTTNIVAITSPAGSAATDADKLAVQNLFEQVVAGSRLKPLDIENINTVSTDKHTDFKVGDKISVYVTFTVTATRVYKIDSVTLNSQSATAKFSYSTGNKTLTADVTVPNKDNNVKTIRFDLTCVVDPS